MDDTLKRRHFSKLHEKIQNKYVEMQRKLEKSRSVDSLLTISDDSISMENIHYSNTDIRDTDSMISENGEHRVGYSVIVEEINDRRSDIHWQYVTVRETSVSETENTPNEGNEKDVTNKFFGSEFSQLSLESLNEIAQINEEYRQIPPPPPTNSIRNKIGSRITAAKDKRRQKNIERNAAKDVKKESTEKVEKLVLSNTKQSLSKLSKKRREATVTIALIEAIGLDITSLEEKSTRLLYCRFRLGSEKYKSKLIKSNASEVKWQELFNFNLFEDHNIMEISLWDKDFCIGRNLIDLTDMEKERTHKMRINLESEVGNSTVQIFILLTISGIFLANTLVDLDDYQETQRELATIKKKFAWYHLKDKSSNVGNLSVIVYGAKGLASQDCFCILQLNNERLQTHTEFKTNDPNWMKIFTFDVKDVTSILEITVHDEKKSEDVGKISLPLLRIKNKEKKWYALKDADLRDRARGNNPRILVEMKLTWNLIRASLRVINPKEVNYLKTENKVDRHVFARNLTRAKSVVNWILNAIKVLKTFLEWESRRMNAISLIIWLIFCWFFKIWMLPLLLLMPFVWYRPSRYYLIVDWKKSLLPTSAPEDTKKEEKHQSLRQKINSLQEMVQTVQNFIGEFANIGESIKNLFNFTVPFLSFLAIFLIVVIAFVMFMIPTKYIFMIWGIHKFTRKILRPNRIPNNEVLDLLSRVPNDEILINCEEITLEEVLDEDVIK